MPKFKVCVHQFVEQTGAVMIEADSAEQAVEAYNGDRYSHGVRWSEGDDQDEPEAYAVISPKGQVVWER